MSPLPRAALELLLAIREADEDHGGLFRHEMSDEDAEVADELVERGLAEVLGAYGEAPDGEEDEREAGGAVGYRVTGRGVEALGAHEAELETLRRRVAPPRGAR